MLHKQPKNNKYPKLFEPGYIGKLWIKNRLVKAPTGMRAATIEGEVSEALLGFYGEQARGGVGLVIVEISYVDEKASKRSGGGLGISKDEHRPGLSSLASVIKANGAAAGIQIFHCGINSTSDRPVIKGPSRIPFPDIDAHGALPPNELTVEEVREIVEAFGNSALRAKQVGFDLVEVHGAHGYLINNFLSPRYNKRIDCYGGTLNNRMRFLLEIVANIRSKVGADYPLSVRLSAMDYEEENPITLEETKQVVKALEKAGVDTIHVSGGNLNTIYKEVPSMYQPWGGHILEANEIKKVVNIPVIGGGATPSPEFAEKMLEQKKADFIFLARALFADPYFPQKAVEGQPGDIRPCIRCLDGCTARRGVGRTQCSVNPTLGNESKFKIVPASIVKKVAVVGGGPAGMEAACVAALRGHNVTLFEKRKLGGILNEISMPTFKRDLRPLIKYQSTQLTKNGIKVIQAEATAQTIKDGKFDAAIIATGGRIRLPDVRGIDRPSVLRALDVLGGAETGNKVVVIGGGEHSCDLALFLAKQGKEVTISTRRDKIVRDSAPSVEQSLIRGLSKFNVKILTGMHLAEVTETGVVMHDRDGERILLVADNVVLVDYLATNTKLFDEVAQLPGLNVYAIGDCVEPRKIMEAIHEGFWAANRL